MHTVLVVDDSGHFLRMAEKVERRTRCRILHASNGSDALTIAREEKPDLIFVDAEMSGMTGQDVCRVLKADPHFARTPMVLVGQAQASGREDGRAAADGFLAKPCDDTTLCDSIRKHLFLFPRDAARAAAGWPVTFWRDGAHYDGTLRDLSRGGFFIRTPVKQPIGARLEVSFDVPGDKPGRTIVAEALIVRLAQEPDSGLGCRFFRITAGSRSVLEDCLRNVEAGGVGEMTGPGRKRETPA